VEAIAVIDFETTGLSPAHGSRATEIAVAIWENQRIVDRYQSLMNAGVSVPYEIEALTGISTAMVRAAPPASVVMQEVSRFVGTRPLAAHNASFDQKFWDAELARIQQQRQQAFICTMLLARRLLRDAPNHKLGTLTRWAGLPATGRAHRALADAEMAANLLGHLESVLTSHHGIRPDSALLCSLQRTPAAKIIDAILRAKQAR
jgi:DNA polymerase-3 subunit epsilon